MAFDPRKTNCKNCGKAIIGGERFRTGMDGFSWHFPFCPTSTPAPKPPVATVRSNKKGLKAAQQLQGLLEELRNNDDFSDFKKWMDTSEDALEDIVGVENMEYVKDVANKSRFKKDMVDALKKEIERCRAIEQDDYDDSEEDKQAAREAVKPKPKEGWQELLEQAAEQQRRTGEYNRRQAEEKAKALEELLRRKIAEQEANKGVTLSKDEVNVLNSILVKAGVIEIDGTIADWLGLKEQAVLQKLTK